MAFALSIFLIIIAFLWVFTKPPRPEDELIAQIKHVEDVIEVVDAQIQISTAEPEYTGHAVSHKYSCRFHKPSCRFAKLLKYRYVLGSKELAIKKGLSACKTCKP